MLPRSDLPSAPAVAPWTPPELGVPAALASHVTAAWRRWKIQKGLVDRAADRDPDCVVVQVVAGAVFVDQRPDKLDHWDSILMDRPWREQRRLAAIELIASVVGGASRVEEKQGQDRTGQTRDAPFPSSRG